MSYLVGGGKENGLVGSEHQLHKPEETNPKKTHVPCDQLDKVFVEGDASTGIKDGGVSVAVEVCGHDLREKWTGP